MRERAHLRECLNRSISASGLWNDFIPQIGSGMKTSSGFTQNKFWVGMLQLGSFDLFRWLIFQLWSCLISRFRDNSLTRVWLREENGFPSLDRLVGAPIVALIWFRGYYRISASLRLKLYLLLLPYTWYSIEVASKMRHSFQTSEASFKVLSVKITPEHLLLSEVHTI